MILRTLGLTVLALAVAGCSRTGEISLDGGVGISAVRSPCPHVAVPAGTGDITLFDPPASRESTAIDVVAVMTNVATVCDESGPDIATTVTFDVLARRRDTATARDVTLPYFVTLVRGGSSVVDVLSSMVMLVVVGGGPVVVAVSLFEVDSSPGSVVWSASSLP